MPMDEMLNMKWYLILLPYKTHEIVNTVRTCITTFF